MNYQYIHNPLGMAGLYVSYGHVGAVSEKAGKYGTSHLMEHMICKNTDDMRDKLQENGIYVNAFTGTDKVVVHVTGLADRMKMFMQEFVEKLLGPIDGITEEQFLNERRTVLNEYGDNFIDPSSVALYNAMRKHFGCYLAIGREEDIKAFTFDDYKKSYSEVFNKPDSIIYIGPEDPHLAIPVYPSVTGMPNTYKYTENSGEALVPVTENGRTQFIIFPKEPVEMQYAASAAIAFKMLASGLNSPLNLEARENRGLTYGVGGFINSVGTTYIPTIFTSTEVETKKELLDVMMGVFGNLDKYLTEERFNTVKGMVMAKKQKHSILLYDNPDAPIKQALGFIDEDKGVESLTFDMAMHAAKKYFSPDALGVYVE